MKIGIEQRDLEKVLRLVMSLDTISASGTGLRLRAKIRKEIIKELIFMLELTEEEAEELKELSLDDPKYKDF